MITLADFITQNTGKYLDYDGWYGSQCVDLVQYWSQNIGGPRFTGDAYQIYNQAGTFFAQIPNPPIGGPKAGDIVVWAYSYNYAGGHTGIATGKGMSTGASSDWFECFEQNDPTGKPCQLKNYSFASVLGWLHPKSIALTWEQKGRQVIDILNTNGTTDTQKVQASRAVYGV